MFVLNITFGKDLINLARFQRKMKTVKHFEILSFHILIGLKISQFHYLDRKEVKLLHRYRK